MTSKTFIYEKSNVKEPDFYCGKYLLKTVSICDVGLMDEKRDQKNRKFNLQIQTIVANLNVKTPLNIQNRIQITSRLYSMSRRQVLCHMHV